MIVALLTVEREAAAEHLGGFVDAQTYQLVQHPEQDEHDCCTIDDGSDDALRF